MADYITPAQVPEVQPSELQDILGFDQSNNWAKIKGSALSDISAKAASAVTTANEAKATAEGIAATAASAVTTAGEAKATAEGIAATAASAVTTAGEAKATAADAAIAATRNDALLMNSSTWNYDSPDVVIYAGNFINGTLDPKPVTQEVNAKCRCLVVQTIAAAHTLTLKGLTTFLASGRRGELLCLFARTGGVTVTDGGTVTYTGEGDAGSLAFRITVLDYGCTLECLSRCSFEASGNIFMPAQPAGSADLGEVNAAIDAVQSVATTAKTTADNAVTTANAANTAASDARNSLGNLVYAGALSTSVTKSLNVNAAYIQGTSPHYLALANTGGVTLRLLLSSIGVAAGTIRCYAGSTTPKVSIVIGTASAGAFTPKDAAKPYLFEIYIMGTSSTSSVLPGIICKCLANCTYTGDYGTNLASLALDDTPAQVQDSDEGYISPEFIEAAMTAYDESEASMEGGDA